jgi:hypothetical protein
MAGHVVITGDDTQEKEAQLIRFYRVFIQHQQENT